jgi:uncharacterized protein (TIGR02145 family)
VLAAQNGVDVSNLVVNAGTVTFDVSWKNTGMPALWSDSVWVFVDYNDAGVMKRLPLLPGATLTAASAPGSATVIQYSGNNQGAWVVGNACSAGSFSATVQLLTAASTGGSESRPLHGACAYASNYRPVGEVTAGTVKFTGTPPYEVVLELLDGGGTIIQSVSSSPYIMPAGYTLLSFTDATGAPGTFTCVPPTISVHPAATSACSGATVQLGVAATNATAYQWKKNGANVSEGSGYTTANYTTAALSGNATYTVVVSNGLSACSTTSNDAPVTVYTAVSPGTITTASAITPAGTAPWVTVQSASPASGGSGNLTYLWVRTGTSAATLSGGDATYALNTDAANYVTGGMYYFNRYAKDAVCSTIVAATGTYTLKVFMPGANQPQGNCTFTPPALVGTFADFDKNYSASTYVTLTDERDDKNYPVVKLNGRWIMARNLNYQKDLTWRANSNQPSTSTGRNTALIGQFWCPGGVDGNNATSSTRESCEVWGALYSWETAMMLDGKWTSSGHSSSAWTERTGYGTKTSSANTQNHGQSDAGATTNGRGICPPNWHVPTDGEWGDILNGMETGKKNHNTSTAWIGTNAGSRGKSTCTCESASGGCNNDADVSWSYDASNQGTDDYGFRVLPAGNRDYNGSTFYYRGYGAYFWSSSANSSSYAWYREFGYNNATVQRYNSYRSFGFSVRCIRDL